MGPLAIFQVFATLFVDQKIQGPNLPNSLPDSSLCIARLGESISVYVSSHGCGVERLGGLVHVQQGLEDSSKKPCFSERSIQPFNQVSRRSYSLRGSLAAGSYLISAFRHGRRFAPDGWPPFWCDCVARLHLRIVSSSFHNSYHIHAADIIQNKTKPERMRA
jgi:hypothetical protein